MDDRTEPNRRNAGSSLPPTPTIYGMAWKVVPERLPRVHPETLALARQLHKLYWALGNRRKLDALYRSMLRRELRRLERECKRRGIDLASPPPPPTTKPNRRPPRRYS